MIIKSFGESNAFELADTPKPVVQPQNLLIKVYATSVNTVDTMIRQLGETLAPLSPPLPAILGMDFAGIVESVGDGVNGFSVGDEVYGCAGGLADLQGSLAEYILADAKLVAHKPKSISMREAAALPLVGITAFEGLVRVGITNNQDVLIHGGSGGVGHIALQLAKYFGANVFSTGGGNKQLQLIEKLGAKAINYKTETVEDYVNKHTDNQGFDIVFDSVGGVNMTNSFAAAKLNGQIVSTVSMVELDLTQAHFKGLSLHVVFMLIPMLHNFKRVQHGKILSKLAKIVDEGKLKPIVDNQRFNLQEVGKAHDHLTSGNAVGKVVVEVVNQP